MVQNVQELINKIKDEGVLAARQKAEAIEAEARKKAEGIIAEAMAQAAKIKAEAEESAKRTDASTRSALAQAARDVLLMLKQDILAMLKKIVIRESGAALSGDALEALIKEAVSSSLASSSDEIVLSVNAKDAEKLSKGFVDKLRMDLGKGLELRARNDRAKGLVISFDGGKSSFDLTDEALAAYFMGFVNEEIGQLLK